MYIYTSVFTIFGFLLLVSFIIWSRSREASLENGDRGRMRRGAIFLASTAIALTVALIITMIFTYVLPHTHTH